MTYAALLERFDPRALNYRLHLSLRHRYLYVEVPKCGCTTIKGNLGRHELIESGASSEEIAAFVQHPHTRAWESPFVKPFQMGASAFDAFLAAPDVLRFAFVRNPFTRAASGYLDKVVPGKAAIQRLRPHLAAVTGVPPDEITGRDISFRQFLLALERSGSLTGINPHFRPQSLQLAADLIPYDVIAPMERLEEELASIVRRTGLDGFRYDRHPHTRRTAERLGDLYDGPSIDMVRRIFADDFRLLGYSLDLEAANEPPRPTLNPPAMPRPARS